MIDKNNLGLIVGIFLAVVHAIWALIIAVIPSTFQEFLDWLLDIHFLEPVWKITKFSFLNAIYLIIITFIFGYILGWLFAWIHNWLSKKAQA